MEFADFCKKRKIVWILNTINQINIALEAFTVINITCVNLVMQKFNESYSSILLKKGGGTDVFDFFFHFATLIKKIC